QGLLDLALDLGGADLSRNAGDKLAPDPEAAVFQPVIGGIEEALGLDAAAVDLPRQRHAFRKSELDLLDLRSGEASERQLAPGKKRTEHVVARARLDAEPGGN